MVNDPKAANIVAQLSAITATRRSTSKQSAKQREAERRDKAQKERVKEEHCQTRQPMIITMVCGMPTHI